MPRIHSRVPAAGRAGGVVVSIVFLPAWAQAATTWMLKSPVPRVCMSESHRGRKISVPGGAAWPLVDDAVLRPPELAQEPLPFSRTNGRTSVVRANVISRDSGNAGSQQPLLRLLDRGAHDRCSQRVDPRLRAVRSVPAQHVG